MRNARRANDGDADAAPLAKQEIAVLNWFAAPAGMRELAQALRLPLARPAARREKSPPATGSCLRFATGDGLAVLADVRLGPSDISQICGALWRAAEIGAAHAVVVSPHVPVCTAYFLEFLNRNRKYEESCSYHGLQLVSGEDGKRELIARTGPAAGANVPSLAASSRSALAGIDKAYARVRLLCERCTQAASGEILMAHPGKGAKELRIWPRTAGACLVVVPDRRRCEYRVEFAEGRGAGVAGALSSPASAGEKKSLEWRDFSASGRTAGVRAVAAEEDDSSICETVARICALLNSLQGLQHVRAFCPDPTSQNT